MMTPSRFPLEPIEKASVDELRALQLKRLKATLQHAYDNSPVYKAKFDLAGVHPGDCTSLADLAKTVTGDVRKGVDLVQSVLTLPLARIAFNAGAEPNDVVRKVCALPGDHGFNAASGAYEDLVASGVIDPARVTCTALMNAGSVAALILTTDTLIADLAEDEDPTAGGALGGGAELLGRK